MAKYSKLYDYYFQAYTAEFFAITMPPWEWFKAQAIAESALNPEARSPVGAVGVMQLMPGTAADMAKKLKIPNLPHVRPVDIRLVPHLNIRMGIAYARQCWDMWQAERGDERMRFMFGSYNAGPGNILKAQRLAERNLLYPDQWLSIVSCLPEITGKHAVETINYVRRIADIYSELREESPILRVGKPGLPPRVRPDLVW